MDTSDSEAFQSADEDFEDEDDVAVKKRDSRPTQSDIKDINVCKNVDDNFFNQLEESFGVAESKQDTECEHKIIKKDDPGRCYSDDSDSDTETVRCNIRKKSNSKMSSEECDDLIKSVGDINLDKDKEEKSCIIKHDLIEIEQVKVQEDLIELKGDDDSLNDKIDTFDNKNTMDDVKNTQVQRKGEYGVPPLRTECWEYESWDQYNEMMNAKKTLKNVDESGDKEVNDWDNDFGDWEINSGKNEVSEKPVIDRGFGIPPKLVICPMVQNRPVTQNVDKSQGIIDKTEIKKLTDETKWDNEFAAWDAGEKNDWDNDFADWDAFDKAESKSKTEKSDNVAHENLTSNKSDSWGNWGGWGVSSLLSTATGSVQTFTNQVSQGLTTVLENSIGIVSPEEMARMQKTEKETQESTNAEDHPQEEKRKTESSVFGLGNLITGVGHITKLVETTGSKVVSTGLDTLEVIGKKTMEVLQENDPGLAKKRALFGLDTDKPVLSQLLREAKERAESETTQEISEKKPEKKRVHYETLFDDHRGLVHLEALEMLSKQCDIKLDTLVETTTGDALEDLRETLVQVKELCELPEDEDDEDDSKSDIDSLISKLDEAVTELGINLSFDKISDCWKNALIEIENIKDENVMHEKAIDTLARLTSAAVEQFHRAAELLLIKERRSTADEADSLVRLTITVSTLIGAIAAKFSEKLDSLSSQSNNPEINSLMTNVFFEATNSSSYVRDAFQLLVSILQAGAV